MLNQVSTVFVGGVLVGRPGWSAVPPFARLLILQHGLLMQLTRTLTLAHTTVIVMATLAIPFSRAKRDMRPPIHSPLQHTTLFGSESIKATTCRPSRQ
jgi:hypothetical protein